MSAYLMLSVSAFAGQALLFVPLIPLLVASGALAADGRLRAVWAVAALAVGIVAGDVIWFAIGRRRGGSLVRRLCRLAGEPDTCVRRTERLFGRYGARALLLAKFVPGLSTVALPLAGAFGMRPRRFVAYDASGVLVWSAAYVIAGYLAAGPVMDLVGGTRAPWRAVLAAMAVLGVYAGWKRTRRRRLARATQIPRLPVSALHDRLAAGEPVEVIDLRHPVTMETDPYGIPGARHVPAELLREEDAALPRDRDIVLYCSCPDEATSASEAVRLRALGFERVSPLAGGLSAWRAQGWPVVLMVPVIDVNQRVLNAR